MVARAGQPIRSSAPPGTGRFKLTRSPARNPSRNAETSRRCPMACIATSRTLVGSVGIRADVVLAFDDLNVMPLSEHPVRLGLIPRGRL